VARIAPALLGIPVLRPTPGEYVADGAARQAAWVLTGGPSAPDWSGADTESFEAEPQPAVRERYAQVRDMTAVRLA
jgi:xylulokinase